MRYDHEAADKAKKQKNNFDELMSHIEYFDPENPISLQFFSAGEYIRGMAFENTKLKCKLAEYGAFFSSLSALLAKQHSVNDIIG